MPRLKRQPDSTRGPRGSESSRILQRRQAHACNLDGDTSPLRSLHSLEAFLAEQRLRIERITNRQIAHVRAVRRELVKQDEQSTRAEVVTAFDLEVLSARGADLYAGIR